MKGKQEAIQHPQFVLNIWRNAVGEVAHLDVILYYRKLWLKKMS